MIDDNINTQARALAAAASEIAPDGAAVAAILTALCDEIARLRSVGASLGPPPAMRLAMYRAAALTACAIRYPADSIDTIIKAAEDAAHEMLAAERAPEVQR